MSERIAPGLLHSRSIPASKSGARLSLSPKQAGWKHVGFAVRQIAKGDAWRAGTLQDEACLVLLSGFASISYSAGGSKPTTVRLGPRRDVFSDYPQALYLPPGAAFEVRALRRTEIADCRSPNAKVFEARAIRPAECGLEVRGGGNATRQIIDILPPSAPADRLLVCEVLTPAGNWSSFPPHKHDRHAPPIEADLDETYYYRFKTPEAYGLQGVYAADGRFDELYRVVDGDLVLIREGYHPFVAAPGCDAYYLNTLAGSVRSMAATDDPRYGAIRQHWPPPDPRVPMVPRPKT